jgi:REP element-mobilizing transposase RayT/DNA-binding response OmpR family regulator
MPTPLLVITADLPFGEHIRQKLEDTGRFAVCVAGDREAAAVYAQEFNPALAFLDTSLAEDELLKIGTILQHANPEIIFVVVSESSWHSALEELFPREYLAKPFYLPDLLELMDRFFKTSTSKDFSPLNKKIGSSNELSWLTDVTRAAQHLTRLTLESSAQAALITRADQLWAYAGQLPQSAAHELANTLSRYWDHQEENDLVRFARLTSTDAEHMLYATRLAEGMVLALVFDAETPFSTIRTQASHLVHSLSSSPSEENPEESEDSTKKPNKNSQAPSLKTGSNPLTDLPVSSEYRLSSDPYSHGSEYELGDLQFRDSPQFKRDTSQGYQYDPQVDTDQKEYSPDQLAETNKSKTRKAAASQETSQATSQRPVPEVARKIVLEPISPAVYNLDYACLLLPRFPHHHMTGDLLDRLGEWVPQICIAFDLRLEYISVRPDYLQWVVNVPPATSPAYLMRVLRQHTSERIFAEFPRFKRDNPSGDFWAPGYLMMSGSQPAPAQLIRDFIIQTRQRQGFTQLINH